MLRARPWFPAASQVALCAAAHGLVGESAHGSAAGRCQEYPGGAGVVGGCFCWVELEVQMFFDGLEPVFDIFFQELNQIMDIWMFVFFDMRDIIATCFLIPHGFYNGF